MTTATFGDSMLAQNIASRLNAVNSCPAGWKKNIFSFLGARSCTSKRDIRMMLHQKDGGTEPLVSILIPCYNSERTIRRCLDSILRQETSVPFDVTVVDSSIDCTSEIVSEEFPSVRLIRRATRTLAGAARNIGVRASRAPYCMMIDSDCITPPDMVERVMARFREGDYAGIGGAICNGTPGSWSGLLCYLMEFKESMPSTPRRTVQTLATANLTYRRDVFERLGGFDDTLWLTEDILFNYKLTLAGYTILFDPEIQVTHLNRTGWRNVLSYQYGMGRMSAAARLRGEMPGRVLLRYPALIFLTPFVRLARAAKWLLDYDTKQFLRFVVISPAYLLGSTIWSVGFFKEIADTFAQS
jgi:GT2 family glycosyltransferase